MDDVAPGTTIGPYQVLSRLGEGGMGTVWRAVHTGLRKPVVIKVLHRDLALLPNALSRFLREGEAAARVRHPHVVEIHDVGTHQGVPYLVMEQLEGEDLAGRITRERAVPLRELAELMLPVCAGVSAAHEEGVVHRDLKPENIFLARTREGALHPKVLDFGISRVVDDTSGRIRTQTAVILGTPAYMSPEQARGERVIDDRSDQYSLGVILYECATGRLPIEPGAPFVVLSRVVAGQYPRPRALRPELPDDFERVVLRAMALSPDGRFPSVRALGAALLPFAGERARLLWSDRFTDASAPAHRATLTLDPRYVYVPPREGANDTLVDEASVRDTTTVRVVRPSRGKGVALGALAGLAVVILALVVWALVSGQ